MKKYEDYKVKNPEMLEALQTLLFSLSLFPSDPVWINRCWQTFRDRIEALILIEKKRGEK